MHKHDLLWLAGLLEGEGCFAYQCSPTIAVGMTDVDVLTRVARLLGGRVRGPYRYAHNKKPVVYTTVFGDTAIAMMTALLPHMGVRRSAKIREIIDRRNGAPGKGHSLGTGAKPVCHPGRRHYAKRLCSACYKKARRRDGLRD